MTSLELPTDLKAGLAEVRVRDGIPQSEQIRRAIRAWLNAHGIGTDGPQKPSAGPQAKTKRGRR
jgi:hypothetical protein